MFRTQNIYTEIFFKIYNFYISKILLNVLIYIKFLLKSETNKTWKRTVAK